MNSGATWTIADGGVSGKLWAGLHHDRESARPHHSIGRARYCRRGGRVTACQMSHMGLVSRASSVQTAVRNCTRDEGGPFEAGSQVLVSSRRKLLSSKAMVVNVAETPGRDPGRQD